MDRGESANEGSCSVEPVIARSSAEEEDRIKNPESISAECGLIPGTKGSNSSLDTVASKDEKKRGRFGALKKSFRKDGGIFKMKKKSPTDNNSGREIAETLLQDTQEVQEEECIKGYNDHYL